MGGVWEDIVVTDSISLEGGMVEGTIIILLIMDMGGKEEILGMVKVILEECLEEMRGMGNLVEGMEGILDIVILEEFQGDMEGIRRMDRFLEEFPGVRDLDMGSNLEEFLLEDMGNLEWE